MYAERERMWHASAQEYEHRAHQATAEAEHRPHQRVLSLEDELSREQQRRQHMQGAINLEMQQALHNEYQAVRPLVFHHTQRAEQVLHQRIIEQRQAEQDALLSQPYAFQTELSSADARALHCEASYRLAEGNLEQPISDRTSRTHLRHKTQPAPADPPILLQSPTHPSHA